MDDQITRQTVTHIITPIILVLSVFVLLRGNYAAGGGLAGGLLAAAAMVLQIIIAGPASVRRILPINYSIMAASGLLLVFIVGSISMLAGLPFLSGLWRGEPVPGIGLLGTPLLLNVALYIIIVSSMTRVALLLAEEGSPAGE